jgi:hypothetical protein
MVFIGAVKGKREQGDIVVVSLALDKVGTLFF